LNWVVANLLFFFPLFQNGISAAAGPLHLLMVPPDRFDYDATADSFLDKENGETLSIGNLLRVRVLQVRVDATEITCIATIAEAALGKVA
jgi:DNA-directed RNA polymerase subunit E'/Rpb7